MTETGTPIVITAAAGPADASVSERVARRRPGHVHHAGAGRPPGGTNGETEAPGIGGMIIDGDETFYILFFVNVCVRLSELCGPRGDKYCGRLSIAF